MQPATQADAHPVPVPHDRVALRGFWGRWQEVVRTVTIPGQHRTMLGTGHLAAFRLGWKPGQPHEPHIFWDSDTAKWIEAAALCLATRPDPVLERLLDEVAALVASAQQPDGYLNTHFTVVEPEQRWANTKDAHELYCAGHLIEAAVAHWRATGRRVLLDLARRLSRCIAATFGREPGKKPGYCGHEEIELALVKLWRATGEREHLELARYFIDQRGTSPNWFEQELAARGVPADQAGGNLAYHQAAVPVRELIHADGHAVRAMYLYCAMADLVAETGDQDLLLALDRLWDSAVGRRMYLTGSVGSTRHGEAFTGDHDLPNRTAYCETCAAIGLAMWAHRMLALRQDARYADVLERALHNGVLAGISLDGGRYFYDNPLASDGAHHRREWFGCACCPPNIARLIASLGGYAYAAGKRELWVHLYAAGRARLEVAGAAIGLEVESEYPWDGRVALRLEPEREVEFGLRLRIPGWCRGARVTVNGQPFQVAAATRDGYLRIDRRWQAGDVVGLELPMPVERAYAHPAVAADRGRVALARGPLVYCLEAADNGAGLDALALPRDAALSARRDDGLLGGVTVIEGQALEPDPGAVGVDLYRDAPVPMRRRRFSAIPYYAWDNRIPGEMQVWIREP